MTVPVTVPREIVVVRTAHLRSKAWLLRFGKDAANSAGFNGILPCHAE